MVIWHIWILILLHTYLIANHFIDTSSTIVIFTSPIWMLLLLHTCTCSRLTRNLIAGTAFAIARHIRLATSRHFRSEDIPMGTVDTSSTMVIWHIWILILLHTHLITNHFTDTSSTIVIFTSPIWMLLLLLLHTCTCSRLTRNLIAGSCKSGNTTDTLLRDL